MKRFRIHPRYLLGVGAGLLLAASFPKLNLAVLAWIAPGLLLGAALGATGREAFRIGYLAGLVHWLASLYWLLYIPVPFAPVVGWLALAAFLALYPACWVWLCLRLHPARGLAPPGPAPLATDEDTEPSVNRVARHLDGLLGADGARRAAWSFCSAALWVAWEMTQARLLTGFPWNFLGVSQYQMLPLLQVASVTGVYGVSFLVAWFSVALLGAVAMVARRPLVLWGWLRELALPLLAVLGVIAWGLRSVTTRPEPGPQLKLALVQPAIPQTMIWDPEKAAARFGELMELSQQALTNRPDILIWPEAAVPSLFRWDTNQIYRGQSTSEAITGLVRQHGIWMILGADDAEPRDGAPEGADFFNSSFLISPQGEVRGSYRKQRLVLFGEYVPLSRWLPFLRRFTQVYGDFTPGRSPVVFELPELGVKTSVLICFEDVFPHLARRQARPELDFLLNLTNDAWFGESAAQWQHAANAVFRAVENGLPLVRVTNNGLTCWVTPRGALQEVYFPGSKDIYQAGVKIVHVPIRAAAPATFYQQHGDWFGWGCVGLAAVVCLFRWRGRSRPSAASAA